MLKERELRLELRSVELHTKSDVQRMKSRSSWVAIMFANLAYMNADSHTHTHAHSHTRSALRAHCESFIQAEFLKFSEHRRRCGKTANWFCLFNFVKLALQIKSGTFVLNCRVNNTTRMSCTSLSLSSLSLSAHTRMLLAIHLRSLRSSRHARACTLNALVTVM